MKQPFVITIGRQLGSGGRSIGEAIARRLGVPLYDRELIELAARESGLCPELFERVDERQSRSLFTTLMGYLRAPFTGYEGGNTDNVLSNEALFKIQSDVIREAAAQGSCVFVGRCADYILRDRPHRVDVFVTARAEDRERRLCERYDICGREARAMMERADASRAAYYNYFSSRTWGAAATYDLCLNSSEVGIDGAADFILRFAERKLDMKF